MGVGLAPPSRQMPQVCGRPTRGQPRGHGGRGMSRAAGVARCPVRCPAPGA